MNVNVNEEDYLLSEKRPVSDRYNLVYLIVFVTGIGVLLPWNFFITIKPYFMHKLSHNQTDENAGNTGNTELQENFLNYLSLASMVPISLTNILNLIIRRYITPMRRFSAGILVMFIMFLITVSLTKISTQNHVILFFTLTMISVVILNVCSGIIQGSSLGIISMMPGRYIKGYMEGQALSGLIASVANIISISVVSSPDNSAFIYFIIALVILAVTAFGFRMLEKMRFSKNYVKLSSLMDRSEEEMDGVTFTDESIPRTSIVSPQSFADKYIPIVKLIFWYGISAAMSFCVTLSLFPVFPSQIVTTSDNKDWNVYFSPVTCFLLYNLSDYIGRFLCGLFNIPSARYPRLLFALTNLRWVFVPLYFMCNIPHRHYFPMVLVHDAFPIIITILFGLTNGYFITLSLIYAPNQVPDKDKEIVGTLMSLFMCIGLAIGVSLSFVFMYII